MRNKGFTLIEIIAVVIIIGVLALIIVPSVSGYISNSRNTAYKAHEKTMEEAAKSLTVEVINGKESFSLPRKGDHAEVFLNELIDKEYLDSLKDPATGDLCNESMSYVIIKNTGSSNYEYKSCLYCGTYITESDECSAPPVEDNEKPVCGMVTGESSEWTNKSRTITVACSDSGSGCARNKFTKVFNTTTDKGIIQISDLSGKTENCEVNARVDKTEPTCELIAEGDDNIESTGWSSGRTVVVKFKEGSRKDEHSGVLTYGIGTSLKNRNYNKQESHAVENVSGTTTVIGYVKDNAGNEGVCYKTVTTGLERPKFDVRYGYQIYPLKERFELSGATQSGDNKITTTTTTPSITFKNMSKYQGVTAVIMELTTGISDPSLFKLVVGGNTYSGSSDNSSNTRIRFYIETEPELNNVSSQSDYKITLGDSSGVTYTITRIELEQKSGNISAKHNVAVNLMTRKAVVKITNWSWDNGSHWENQYYKLFDPTTGAKTGNARIKNDIPLTSGPVPYSIAAGDGTAPSITITSGNTDWTNQDITLTGKVKDTGTGLIGYMWSTSNNVHYYDAGWQYYDNPTTDEKIYTYTVTKNGTYYLYAKDEAGNVGKKSITVTNIDKIVPTCSAITGNGNQAILSCSDPAATTDYGQSKLVKYYFGQNSSPTNADFTSISERVSYSETKTLGSSGAYYLFVIDKAGNKSTSISDAYYTITFNGNGATTAGSASGIIRYKAKSISTITNPVREYTVSFDKNGTGATATTTAKKATYTLNGWYTAATNGSKVASNATTPALQASVDGYTNASKEWTKTSGATLFAQWTSASVTLPTISKTGYTCKWNTNKTGSGTSYDGGSSYTPTANITLYVVCTANSYSVTFDVNGGSAWTSSTCTSPSTFTSSNSSCKKNVTYDSTYGTLPTAKKTGYTLSGWYTSASGGTKIESSTAVAITAAQTLHAHWTANTYTVTLNGNGATTAGSTSATATYDKTALSSITNPKREYTVSFDKNGTGATATTTAKKATYTLNGWYTAATNGSKVANNDATPALQASVDGYTNASKKWIKTSNATLYAQWTSSAITLPTITKSCYKCYWNTNSSGTGTNYNGGSSYTPGSTHTLYANCIPNTYTISYDYKSGTAPSSGVPSSFKYLTGATVNGTPTRSGYTFNGWTWGSNKSFTHIVDGCGNQSLSANWCQNCVSPVSNGSCTLNVTTAGSCSYSTSCNDGYEMMAGNGTRDPKCCPRCSVSNGTCTPYYDNGCKKSISCNSGYKLQGETCVIDAIMCDIQLGHILTENDGYQNAQQQVGVLATCGWGSASVILVSDPDGEGYGSKTNSRSKEYSDAINSIYGCITDNTNEYTDRDPNVPWLHWLQITCSNGRIEQYRRDHNTRLFSKTYSNGI